MVLAALIGKATAQHQRHLAAAMGMFGDATALSNAIQRKFVIGVAGFEITDAQGLRDTLPHQIGIIAVDQAVEQAWKLRVRSLTGRVSQGLWIIKARHDRFQYQFAHRLRIQTLKVCATDILQPLDQLPTVLTITQMRGYTGRLGNGKCARRILYKQIHWGVMMCHRYLIQTTLMYVDITRVMRKRFTSQHQ